MGPAVYDSVSGTWNSRFVRFVECDKADELNNTPYESANGTSFCQRNSTHSCCSSCPILLDLDDNGLDLTGIQDAVAFDLNGDGSIESLGWTSAGGDDAFLALDRNGNGVIDTGRELFGNYTELVSGKPAAHGYAALAEYDLTSNGGNQDGCIDDSDAVFAGLLLWLDHNHNGISEIGELESLKSRGVKRLGLDYKESKSRDKHGNELRFRATAWIAEPDEPQRRIKTVDVFFVVSAFN